MLGGLVRGDSAPLYRLPFWLIGKHHQEDAIQVRRNLLDVLVSDGAVWSSQSLFQVQMVVAFPRAVQVFVQAVARVVFVLERAVDICAVLRFHLRPEFPVPIDAPGHYTLVSIPFPHPGPFFEGGLPAR